MAAAVWMDAVVHHLAISVQNIDKAVQFYRDYLGFQVEWDRRGIVSAEVVGLPDADARQIMLKGYGLRVELFKYFTPKGQKIKPNRQCDFGITHFALSVKDIHTIYQRLVENGVQFNCPPLNFRPGAWATYLKDPEGIMIELIEYTEAK